MVWFQFLRNKVRSSKRFLTRRYSKRRAQTRLYHFPTSIAVFGAPNSGKTTITRRFSEKYYPDDFQRVTEIYKITITTKSKNGITCKHDLSVHDTPGNLSGTFPDLYEEVIRKVDAFIIVYSLIDPISTTIVSKTIQDLYRIRGNKVPVMIMANKFDIAGKDEHSIEERFKFYKEISKKDFPFIEISSTQGENFKQNWIPLLHEIEKRQGIRSDGGPPIYLDDDMPPSIKRRHTVRYRSSP